MLGSNYQEMFKLFRKVLCQKTNKQKANFGPYLICKPNHVLSLDDRDNFISFSSPKNVFNIISNHHPLCNNQPCCAFNHT